MRVFHVYAKIDCPFCKRAVGILQNKKEHFSLTILDHAPQVLTSLSEEFSWNTVPIITLVEKYEDNPSGVKLVGGCEDLERFFKEENNAKEAKAKQATEKYQNTKESTGESETD